MSGSGSWLTAPRRSSTKGRARPRRPARRWSASFTGKSASRKWNWIFWHAGAEPGGEASDDRPTEQAPVANPAMPGAGAQSLYYQPAPDNTEDLSLMALIDRQFLETPYYGSRKMTAWLRREGHVVNRKRVRRLMRQMGLQVIWQKPNTSKPNPEHKVYPYLLRGLTI